MAISFHFVFELNVLLVGEIVSVVVFDLCVIVLVSVSKLVGELGVSVFSQLGVLVHLGSSAPLFDVGLLHLHLVHETIIVNDCIIGIVFVLELPIVVVVSIGELVLVPVFWSPKILEVLTSWL